MKEIQRVKAFFPVTMLSFRLFICAIVILLFVNAPLAKFLQWHLARKSHTKSLLRKRSAEKLIQKEQKRKQIFKTNEHQALISRMIRRSSVVDLLVRKVMTCFSSCWLTVALVDWHLCCFQQKPGQKRSFYLHLVLRPLLYLSSKVAEAVVRRCWICWKQNKPIGTRQRQQEHKQEQRGRKKPTDWNKRCNLKESKKGGNSGAESVMGTKLMTILS